MSRETNFEQIDYVKGIAILLVFIGHAATPSFLQRPQGYEFVVQFIYSFHMALFFLVSGFLSKKIIHMDLKKDYLGYVKSKFYRLIIPFLTISFLTNIMIIILKITINEPLNITAIVEMIKTILFYPEDGLMGALWFLYTLFAISVISPIILKLPFKLTIIFALGINILVPQYQNFLSVSRVSFFLIYYLIGLYFREFYFDTGKFNNKTNNAFIQSIIFILSLAGMILYTYVISNNLSLSGYTKNILHFLCGLFGIIVITNLITKINNNIKLKKALSILGKYSMDIYLFSWFFQIASMIAIVKVLKITNYNIFFISNMLVGTLCLPFSIYFVMKFKMLKVLFLGETYS